MAAKELQEHVQRLRRLQDTHRGWADAFSAKNIDGGNGGGGGGSDVPRRVRSVVIGSTTGGMSRRAVGLLPFRPQFIFSVFHLSS